MDFTKVEALTSFNQKLFAGEISVFDKENQFVHQSNLRDQESASKQSLKANQQEQDVFEKITSWFQERNIRQGHPQTIHHSYHSRQRQILKVKKNQKNIPLENSLILFRRKQSSINEQTKVN